MTGWGAYCNGERTGGFWSPQEVKRHINFLELLAVFNGLKCFARNLNNVEILLRINNTTAISYINKFGGVQYVHLNNFTRKIWQWCESRQLYTFASYIKSKDNVEADEESRHRNIDTEWSLSPAAFQKITLSFEFPEIE